MSRRTAHGPQARSGRSLLWGLVHDHRAAMGRLALVAFVGAMLEAAFLVLLTATLLAVAGGHSHVGPLAGHSLSVLMAVIIAGVAIIARFALTMASVRIGAGLSAVVRNEQRSRLAHAYLGAHWSVQQEQPTGRLQELLTSFVGRINLAVTAITQGVTAALSLLAFFATGLALQPWATLGVLAVLALLGLILGPLRRAIRSRAGQTADADLAFATAISELGGLTQEMQTFGVRRAFASRIDKVIEDATEHQRVVTVLTGSLSPTYTLFVYAAVLGGVGALAAIGTGEVQAVGAVMLLMLRSMAFGQQLSAVSGTIASAVPSVERLESALAEYAEQPADDGHAWPSAPTPLLLEKVTFAYTGDRPALRDVSLALTRGSALGVIGPSGAGKSSLAQLLLGLRAPDSGRLTVDGVDLREVDRTWWTSRVAFVPQTPQLFTGTVAENIRFFREGIDDTQVHRAAEQAGVLEDIRGLPQGFNTHLGERGGRLSGGQRQRLSIARALAGRPELLVLDEPTSALDGHSEALIQLSLAGLHGEITLVVIAHRLTTLDLCDHLLVLEDGAVSAYGTPEELRSRSAFYQRALALAGVS